MYQNYIKVAKISIGKGNNANIQDNVRSNFKYSLHFAFKQGKTDHNQQ